MQWVIRTASFLYARPYFLVVLLKITVVLKLRAEVAFFTVISFLVLAGI